MKSLVKNINLMVSPSTSKHKKRTLQLRNNMKTIGDNNFSGITNTRCKLKGQNNKPQKG
jgi:hypothetical protein